jgi:hypothetical protein
MINWVQVFCDAIVVWPISIFWIGVVTGVSKEKIEFDWKFLTTLALAPLVLAYMIGYAGALWVRELI